MPMFLVMFMSQVSIGALVLGNPEGTWSADNISGEILGLPVSIPMRITGAAICRPGELQRRRHFSHRRTRRNILRPPDSKDGRRCRTSARLCLRAFLQISGVTPHLYRHCPEAG